MTSSLGCKITFITEQQLIKQQNRLGFMPVCCYGSLKPMDGEIGGIFKNARNARFERDLFVQDAVCVERVVLRPNQGLGAITAPI